MHFTNEINQFKEIYYKNNSNIESILIEFIKNNPRLDVNLKYERIYNELIIHPIIYINLEDVSDWDLDTIVFSLRKTALKNLEDYILYENVGEFIEELSSNLDLDYNYLIDVILKNKIQDLDEILDHLTDDDVKAE